MREDRLAKTRNWLNRLLHRGESGEAGDDTSGDARSLAWRQARTVAGSAAYQWETVASVNSAPLGGMYADLLRQAGIPVLMRGWQSVPMAGAPIGVTVLVPQERITEARAILGLDDAALPDGAGAAKPPESVDDDDAV